MLLGRSDTQHFLASYLYTDNTYFDYSYIPFGTELLNKTRKFNNEMFNMQMPDGMVVHQSVINSCELVSSKLLKQAGLTLEDIDVVITSDQTTFTWKAQLEKLGVSEEKSTSCVLPLWQHSRCPQPDQSARDDRHRQVAARHAGALHGAWCRRQRGGLKFSGIRVFIHCQGQHFAQA